MFIEKLSYEEEVMLVRKFAKHIDKNCKVDDWFKVENFGNFDNICFSINGNPYSCCFKDFEITMSFGTKAQVAECTNMYRAHMYHLFGEKYLQCERNHYTINIAENIK